jgi:HSP20 family protein
MMWNFSPWEELESQRRQVQEAFGRFGWNGGSDSFPLINAYDNEDDVVIVAEMAGVKKKNINVVMDNGVLIISGRREPLLEDRKSDLIRAERTVGEFKKSLRIPVKVLEDQINAVFSNGMLTITVPKSEEAKPKSIAIEVK